MGWAYLMFLTLNVEDIIQWPELINTARSITTPGGPMTTGNLELGHSTAKHIQQKLRSYEARIFKKLLQGLHLLYS